MKSSHRAYSLALALFVLLMFVTGFQSRSPKLDVRGVEKTNSQTVTYSPTDFGMNNIVLPASADTAYSTVINTVGVRALSMPFICSQNVDVRAQYYAEDGITVLNAGGNQIRANASAGAQMFYMGTEVDNSSTSGSVGVSSFRLPQRAISFAFRNTTATPGTCTARLFLFYD